MQKFLKRTFDITISTAVILIALPLWTIISLAIKLNTRGSIFYRGKRTGKDGKIFHVYKFRTMVANAAQKGPGITSGEDVRITRVGRFLRKFKLDEMPQLINVLKGEMSIIGPRPEDPRYVANYTSEQRQVLTVQPGMASPAFIKYRHEEEILAAAGENWEEVYVTKVLPDKLKLDLDYIRGQSFLYDVKIFFQAASSLFTSH